MEVRRRVLQLVHDSKEPASKSERERTPMSERLVLSVDPGSKDWSAVAVMQQMEEGHWRVQSIAEEFVPMQIGLMRRISRMVRDYSRPQGYSQSHWRKLWKERLGLGKSGSTT